MSVAGDSLCIDIGRHPALSRCFLRKNPHTMPVAINNMSTENFMDDSRIAGYEPLMPPSLLRHDLPSSEASRKTVNLARQTAAKIVHGEDDRLLVIVGPCSIHDTKQAIEYANLLQNGIKEGRWPDLGVIMRAYFEKPRTTVGWKGLLNDPDGSGSCRVSCHVA